MPISARIFLASLELLVVSKRGSFKQASWSSSNYSQPLSEMREEILSSLGTQFMDTFEYQGFHLEDVQCYWVKDQLEVDVVFTPENHTPLPPTAFADLEM